LVGHADKQFIQPSPVDDATGHYDGIW
jgi:hypothetical protein